MKYATRQRKALLDFFCQHPDELYSAKQITDLLAPDCVSISAVYRNLAALEADGKVQRITKGGNKRNYYRYLDAEGCREHLHLSCSECGKTYHMDPSATDTLISNVMREFAFQVDSVNTVLYGICRACGDLRAPTEKEGRL